MSYSKNTWQTGDTVTAELLNHMEDGISSADAKELPTVSGSDNGKVLTVSSGAWSAQTPSGGGLPPKTATDVGVFPTVNYGGAWSYAQRIGDIKIAYNDVGEYWYFESYDDLAYAIAGDYINGGLPYVRVVVSTEGYEHDNHLYNHDFYPLTKMHMFIHEHSTDHGYYYPIYNFEFSKIKVNNGEAKLVTFTISYDYDVDYQPNPFEIHRTETAL